MYGLGPIVIFWIGFFQNVEFIYSKNIDTTNEYGVTNAVLGKYSLQICAELVYLNIHNDLSIC